MLVFLAAYVWIVTILADHVPRVLWIETLFYVAAGMLWGVPLIPLIRWMNGGAPRPDPDGTSARRG